MPSVERKPEVSEIQEVPGVVDLRPILDEFEKSCSQIKEAKREINKYAEMIERYQDLRQKGEEVLTKGEEKVKYLTMKYETLKNSVRVEEERKAQAEARMNRKSKNTR